MKLLPVIAVLMAVSTPALAQNTNAPAGADALDCEGGAFTPVISERTGEILYWNNTTCASASGASDMMMDGMTMNGMDSGMMDGGMMDDGMMDGGMDGM